MMMIVMMKSIEKWGRITPIVALQSYPQLNSASSPAYSLSISSSALATDASTTGESSMFWYSSDVTVVNLRATRRFSDDGTLYRWWNDI
jgi:hypothetical protein